MLLAAVLIFASLKNWLKPIFVALGIALFAFIDLAMINKTYLNSEIYQDKNEVSTSLDANAKDREILADKSNYRVFNVNGNGFSEAATSYVFNSVGGYHSVKLRLYQDLIERQFSKQGMNEGILDMLNVKYLLQKDRNDKTVQYQQRNTALGNAWFVKNIQFVKDADAEMNALNTLNPKDTAIVQEQYKSSIPFTVEADTSATIRLVKNDNDYIEYEANNTKNQFAVFSEIYYKSGWKAFVDGKEQPIVKANYALRGLALSPGKHKVEFKFKPEGYVNGSKYGSIANIILALLLLSVIGYFYLENKKGNL
jgi:Bacterial membrane protein YfhO